MQPVLDGAVRLAAKWAEKEAEDADKMFIEGVDVSDTTSTDNTLLLTLLILIILYYY